MGARGARPRPQVVGAARMRVVARLGLDAVGRLLESAGAAYRRRANTARVGPGARRSNPPACPCVRDAQELQG